MCVSISGLSVVLPWYICVLCQYHAILITVVFIVSLKIKYYMFSKIFYLEIILVKISIYISTKKSVGILIWNLSNLQINLEKTGILKICSLLIQSIHLFTPSFISLNNVFLLSVERFSISFIIIISKCFMFQCYYKWVFSLFANFAASIRHLFDFCIFSMNPKNLLY